MAGSRQMHPDLVCPSRGDMDPEQGSFAKLPFNLPVSMGFLPACRIQFHPGRAAPRYLADRNMNFSGTLHKTAFRQGQIFFPVPALLPIL